MLISLLISHTWRKSWSRSHVTSKNSWTIARNTLVTIFLARRRNQHVLSRPVFLRSFLSKISYDKLSQFWFSSIYIPVFPSNSLLVHKQNLINHKKSLPWLLSSECSWTRAIIHLGWFVFSEFICFSHNLF